MEVGKRLSLYLSCDYVDGRTILVARIREKLLRTINRHTMEDSPSTQLALRPYKYEIEPGSGLPLTMRTSLVTYTS